MPTHYDVLDVDSKASQEELRRAYQRLALQVGLPKPFEALET